MATDNEINSWRRIFEKKTDHELIAEVHKFVAHSAQHIAAKQLLATRQTERERLAHEDNLKLQREALLQKERHHQETLSKQGVQNHQRARYRVVFGHWEDTSPSGLDGVEYGFPFEVIQAALIGTPEEKVNTQSHRGLVAISRTRLAAWRLGKIDIPKILFEYAKREIERMVAAGALPSEQFTFRLLNLTTENAPDKCPFDPTRIDDSIGVEIMIEEAEPVYVTSRDGRKWRLS